MLDKSLPIRIGPGIFVYDSVAIFSAKVIHSSEAEIALHRILSAHSYFKLPSAISLVMLGGIRFAIMPNSPWGIRRK